MSATAVPDVVATNVDGFEGRKLTSQQELAIWQPAWPTIENRHVSMRQAKATEATESMDAGQER
jgi:hypothetical protein